MKRICELCGCTDAKTCQPGGCSWVSDRINICTTHVDKGFDLNTYRQRNAGRSFLKKEIRKQRGLVNYWLKHGVEREEQFAAQTKAETLEWVLGLRSEI